MTAYLSNMATAPLAPSPVHGQASTLQVLYCSVALTAAVTTADTIQFFTLPPNARIHSAMLKCTDIDTGGPTVTINVGDAGLATRYFSASVAGQAGTVDGTMNPVGRFYKTGGAKVPVVGSIQANPTTGVAGTLELAIHFVVEDSAIS